MTYLLALLAAGLPAIPMRLISNQSLARARDWWLLLMLAMGTVWAIRGAPPFVPIGLFFLLWWPTLGRLALPSVLAWVGLGAFWWALSRLPADLWAWIPWGWLLIGAAAAGTLAFEWWTLRTPWPEQPWWHPYRPLHKAAWFGQRTLAAAFFALLLPFAPWWTLPVPLLGLAVTSSWGAILAAYVGWLVLAPIWALSVAAGGLLVAMLGLWATGRDWNWLLEQTPRGSSLDSLWQRGRMSQAMLRAMVASPRPPLLRNLYLEAGPQWNGPWWHRGFGPRTMEPTVIRWGALYGTEEIPLGHAHLDILQFLFEYGPCGVATCLILVGRVAPHLAWGDPWSAAWVTGVVLGCVTLPFRVASVGLVWLAISVKLGG